MIVNDWIDWKYVGIVRKCVGKYLIEERK